MTRGNGAKGERGKRPQRPDQPIRAGVSLRFALQPDPAAIAVIMGKAIGPRVIFDWRDFSAAEYASAFVVAKALERDVLADILAGVRAAIKDGWTLEQFRTGLEPLLRKRGWWGRKEMADPQTGEVRLVQLGSAARLEIIYDTNMRMAHAAGRWERYERQAEMFPYLRYQAVLDGRTRAEHASWHGVMLPVNHPFWKTHYPPNGWRCRCRIMQVSTAEALRRRWRVTSPAELARKMGAASEVLNKRTGRTEAVWPGIDPGFAHNAGMVREEVLEQQLGIASTNAVQPSLPFLNLPPNWDIDIDDDVLTAGLFDSREAIVDATRALLAGIPDGQVPTVTWRVNSSGIKIAAKTPQGTQIQRIFMPEYGESFDSNNPPDDWWVYHEYFKIEPGGVRNRGAGRAMMAFALPLYDSLGISRIIVHTGLNDGGFVWARLGFVPDDPDEMRDEVIGLAEARAPEHIAALVADIAQTADDDDFMWEVASLLVDGVAWGHKILAGSSWSGYFDLTNPVARRRAEKR